MTLVDIVDGEMRMIGQTSVPSTTEPPLENAVIGILEEEKLVEGAKQKGAFLGEQLAALAREMPDICEGERGEGLLRGLVLKKGYVVRDILPKLADAGVLLTAAGERVLRFSPPLVVTEAELQEGVVAVRNVLKGLPPLPA